MYKYKFVKVTINTFKGAANEDYQLIIQKHASEGWKLHSLFTPPMGSGGQASYIDLIFERQD